MSGEERHHMAEDLQAALSGLPAEEIARRLAFYAQRLSDRGRERLLVALCPDDDSGPSFVRIMFQVGEFIDRVRGGDFAGHAVYDSEFGYEHLFGDGEWEEELGEILTDVDLVFDSGRRVQAALAYGPLLHILDEAGEEGLLSEPVELPFDIDGTKARYLRGLYETLPSEERAGTLLNEFEGLYAFGEALLTLKDIEAVAGEPLPDLDEFLPLWRQTLGSRSGRVDSDHLRELSMEAWIRAMSPEEMLEEIRRQASTHPGIWLGGAIALRREGRPDDALAAAEEGLSAAAEPRLRAQLGIFLAATAGEADEPELVLTGLREAFRASGRVDLLLLLLDELIDDPDLRDGILEEEAEHLSGDQAKMDQCALLMVLAGKHEHAARTLSEAAPFRWSYYQTIMQVTLGALLRGAAGGCPEGSSIGEIWSRYVEAPDAPRDNFSGYESLAPEPRLSLAERLEESLATHPLGETERLHVLALVRPMVEERVRTVVRAKTSDWYPDVAALITALAEALALTGRTTQAKRIHNGLVVDFPRHRGFRREMNDALQASPILH